MSSRRRLWARLQPRTLTHRHPTTHQVPALEWEIAELRASAEASRARVEEAAASARAMERAAAKAAKERDDFAAELAESESRYQAAAAAAAAADKAKVALAGRTDAEETAVAVQKSQSDELAQLKRCTTVRSPPSVFGRGMRSDDNGVAASLSLMLSTATMSFDLRFQHLYFYDCFWRGGLSAQQSHLSSTTFLTARSHAFAVWFDSGSGAAEQGVPPSEPAAGGGR